MLDLGFIHALKQIVRLLPAKRQTLFFSATDAQDDQGARRQIPHRSRPGLGRARRDHRERVDQYVTFVQQARKAGFAHHDAAPRLFRARQYGAGADLLAHQARRRPDREITGGERHPRQRHPRQQEPAAARARSGRVQGRAREDPGRDRHRRARHRRHRRQPRDQFRAAQRPPSNMSTGSAAPRAPAPRASPSRSAPTTRRPICAISRN